MSVGRGLYGLPEPELPPRPPSRWRWPIRIGLGFAIMLGISITTLSILGGNSDSMKESLEKYISDITGYEARIEKLNAVSFYPVLGMDIDGLVLTESGAAIARFDHVNFSTGFWATLAGRSSLRTFDIRNGAIDAGIFAPLAINIDHFKIDTETPGQPAIALAGKYGIDPVNLQAGLTRKETISGASFFDLAKNSRLTIEAGDIEFSGMIGTGPKGERTILVENFTPGENMTPVKGDLSVVRRTNDLGATGHIEAGSSKMDFDVSLRNDRGFWTITGKAHAARLNLGDVFDRGGLVDGYAALKNFYFGGQLKESEEKPFDFSMVKADLKTEIDMLSNGSFELGSVSGPLSIADGVLGISPLLGEIKGGILAGTIALDATRVPAQFSADLNIKNLDYTRLSSMVKSATDNHGRADIKIALAAKGNNGDSLWQDLDGKMMVIAGEGELSSPLISLWGGGLLNAMLPSFGKEDRLRLNCGIGDFEITDGIAQTKTFFLDTDGVTVIGDGTINFKESTIDLKLEPKSKGAAFFSAATAVHLKGPLEKPSIDPDVFSLGKKLGGLFLGTINPAFLAFSLTDFGFSDAHPCQAYIKP